MLTGVAEIPLFPLSSTSCAKAINPNRASAQRSISSTGNASSRTTTLAPAEAKSPRVWALTLPVVAGTLNSDSARASWTVPGSCLRDCYFANVALPLEIIPEREQNGGSGGSSIPLADADAVIQWIREVGVAESACYAQICVYRDVFWWRLSGMVYVEVADFVGAGEILVGLCERASRGEYLEGKR
ncbi:hypothetical protein EKO27_g4168 [Xylaria grammica]|uniref:Uncharacterized protein n=1 Tax=Xylaria grammica TaxID=363999 RepID=A0A439D967_9PEZI|nr:hypothetical protein EKO27_g4168 [Xylaria grammica]